MAFTFSDVQKWISEWESPAVEFKSSVQKDAGDTICAFANTYGGVLIFGVDSKNREPKGLQNPDEESKRLRSITEECKPRPNLEQEFVRHEGKTFIVLKLDAFSYSQNPCFYGDFCFIREGTTNLKLRGDNLIDFLRKRAMLNFEDFKSDAPISALDFEKINQLLKKRGISSENLKESDYKTILTGLNVAGYSTDFFLKNDALFFFAKEPQKFFSNLEVRIVKYAGVEPELRTLKMDKRIYGTLPEVINKSFDTIIENVGTRMVIVGTQREEIPEYPIDSLRELITNAVGHRDYSDKNDVLMEIFEDRVQIANPGSLLIGQNINNFDKLPQHRNPTTYQLLRDFGFGEGLGLGVRLIRREFREAKLPDPEFNEIGRVFQAIIYNQISRRKRYENDFENERQKQALVYLRKNKTMKAEQYEKMVGVKRAAAVRDLNELIKQGKIRKIGKFRGAYYELDDTGRSNDK